MKKLLIVIFTIGQLHAHAQSLYGNMENWRNAPVSTTPSLDLKLPDHWYSTDSVTFLLKILYPGITLYKQTFQTTDAHTGAFAVKLVTVDQDVLGVSSTLFTNSKVSIDLSSVSTPADAIVLEGGTPIPGRVTEVSAWVKYLPVGNDSAEIYATALLEKQGANGKDSIVGEGFLKLGEITAYTKISLPMTYISNAPTPDVLRIIMTSSSDDPQENSTLYIDDVGMQVTGIQDHVKAAELMALYPNPATDRITFKGIKKDTDISIDIFAENGQHVGSRMLKGEAHYIVSGLPPGNYYYKAVCDRNSEEQSGKFIILK